MIKPANKLDFLLIALLGLYSLTVIALAALFFIQKYATMNPEQGYSEAILLQLILAIGVVAGAARCISELLSDVGDAKYTKTRRLSLSYFLRPWQGGCAAVIAYFIVRAALVMFEKGWPTINPWGFFALAGLAGLGAHRLLDRLAARGKRAGMETGRVTARTISAVFEHVNDEIERSEAEETLKEDAVNKLIQFLSQPLVTALFGGALLDLLTELRSRPGAQDNTSENHTALELPVDRVE